MKTENPFQQYLAKLDAQELADIVLNYVDDKDDVRNFIDSILDEEIKEQLIEDFNEEEGANGIFVPIERSDDELDIGDLTNQIDDNPENAELHLMRAIVFRAMGKTDEAIVDLRKTMGLKDNISRAYEMYVEILEEAGKPIEALEVSSQGIEKVGNGNMFNLRGTIYISIGRYDEAHRDFTSAIQLDSGDKIFYLNRGSTTLLAYGDPKEALGDFLKCRELSPDFDPANITFYITEAESRINGNPPNQLLLTPEIQIIKLDENKTNI